MSLDMPAFRTAVYKAAVSLSIRVLTSDTVKDIRRRTEVLVVRDQSRESIECEGAVLYAV